MATAEEFLADCAANPSKLGLFLKDPEAALNAAGVGGDDRDAAKISVYKEAHDKLFVWGTESPQFVWGAGAFVWG